MQACQVLTIVVLHSIRFQIWHNHSAVWNTVCRLCRRTRCDSRRARQKSWKKRRTDYRRQAQLNTHSWTSTRRCRTTDSHLPRVWRHRSRHSRRSEIFRFVSYSVYDRMNCHTTHLAAVCRIFFLCVILNLLLMFRVVCVCHCQHVLLACSSVCLSVRVSACLYIDRQRHTRTYTNTKPAYGCANQLINYLSFCRVSK